MRFIDHQEAGKRLAARLAGLGLARPVVLAIPPAGVRIGWEIARRLKAWIDVLVVDEVEIPGRLHATVGVVVDGDFFPDEVACRRQGVTPGYAAILASAVKRNELAWEDRLRSQQQHLDLAGRSAILVSDAPLDSARLRAVHSTLLARGAREIVYACPFAYGEIEVAGAEIHAVTLFGPGEKPDVMLVNTGYEQTTDDEIATLLAQSRRGAGRRPEEKLGIDYAAVAAASVDVTAG